MAQFSIEAVGLLLAPKPRFLRMFMAGQQRKVGEKEEKKFREKGRRIGER